MTELRRMKEKKDPPRVLSIPSPGKSTGTARVWVGWLMVHAACSSAKRFPASCFRRRSPRGSIVSKSSRRCRIASERTRMSTERVRHVLLKSTRAFRPHIQHFRIEIMNDDDDDDEEAPAGSTTVGDAAPASPSPSAESTPVQVSSAPA